MRSEPINLCEWEIPPTISKNGRLWTCGRPGRGAYGRKWKKMDDATVRRWVEGLPKAEVLHIVSLLGKKKNGCSEFWYYSFRSEHERGMEPTFQQWLNENVDGCFRVHEFPTTDRQGIAEQLKDEIVGCVRTLLQQGCTVVIVDSAGAERTARICEHLGCKKRRKGENRTRTD